MDEQLRHIQTMRSITYPCSVIRCQQGDPGRHKNNLLRKRSYVFQSVVVIDFVLYIGMFRKCSTDSFQTDTVRHEIRRCDNLLAGWIDRSPTFMHPPMLFKFTGTRLSANKVSTSILDMVCFQFWDYWWYLISGAPLIKFNPSMNE